MVCDFFHYNIVGEQNLPPQNASLACELFWAENTQGPKDSGKFFDLPLNCLKKADRRPVPGREVSPYIMIVWTRWVDKEGPSKFC